MPHFENNQQRLEHAAELAERDRETKARIYQKIHRPFGGDSQVAKSCYRCLFIQDKERCSNPAVKLQGILIERSDLRGDTGICGPDGLFFKKKAFLKRGGRPLRAGIVSWSVLAILGTLFWFFGWQAFMWIGIGLLALLVMLAV